jgi:hypothetical protein
MPYFFADKTANFELEFFAFSWDIVCRLKGLSGTIP